MARPSKKAVSKAQEASKALDRIFAEVDPNLLVAGLLGGTATLGGIIPPFTRLMMVMGDSGADYQKLFDAGATTFGYGFAGVIPGLFKLYTGSTDSNDPTGGDPTKAALFASGALEAMLMYKAFSTPGLLESVVSAPAKIIDAVVPG